MDTEPEKQAQTEVPQKTTVETNDATKSKNGGSKVFLIVLIIVVALAILATGGYLIYKYAGKKIFNKISGDVTTEKSEDKSAGTTSVKALIEMLLYPGSEILDQKQEMDGVYVAEVTLSSKDSVDTIKDYYLDLVKDKNWKITQQGSDADFDDYYITFTDDVFIDSLDITKYDLDDYTTIRHRLNGEDLISDGLYVPTTSNNSTSKSTTSSNSDTTNTANSTDYIISDSNTREISKSELINFTPWQLKVARNEIYARHGRPFVHKDLQCYFATKSWYSEDSSYNVSSISYIENKNIATIQSYEQETNSPLASQDSGCNTNQ